MNFQDLKKVEKAQFYLDVAFRKASKISGKKVKTRDRLQKAITLELTRLDIINNTLTDDLKKIITGFPSIDNLDIFYRDLIKCTIEYKFLKKSLGAINWAVTKINEFYKIYRSKIKKTKDYNILIRQRREYYGRISSILKQIKKHLFFLEESRKIMRGYPAIKTSMFTVCLFGFPNVGKSTLLSKITDAKPEIQAYAFTTKKLNLGYIKDPLHKIQVIDTPGTLNRVNKMNNIELQAYLAAKHLANLIVFVFDPTDEFHKQKKLLEKVDKEILLYLSKADIADKKIVNDYKKKYPKIITDAKKLRLQLINNSAAFNR